MIFPGDKVGVSIAKDALAAHSRMLQAFMLQIPIVIGIGEGVRDNIYLQMGTDNSLPWESDRTER